MKVISNDGEVFEIEDDIIKQSTLLKQFSDAEGTEGLFPLSNVKGSILKPIIEFCNHHKNDLEAAPNDSDNDPNRDTYESRRSAEISEWDRTFIQQFPVQEGALVHIIIAANYLGINTLTAVGCRIIAEMIHEKTSASEEQEMLHDFASRDQTEDESTTNINESELTEPAVCDDVAVVTSEADSIDK